MGSSRAQMSRRVLVSAALVITMKGVLMWE